jgi:transcriptional regulator with XRE-family HTH domain
METKPTLRIDRIEALMESKGWTVADLAAMSGLTYDSVYKIVNNMRPRTYADSMALIADALGTTVQYLMGMTDNRNPQLPGSSETVLEIADVARGVKETTKIDILLVAKGLAQADKNEDAAIEAAFLEVYKLGGQEMYDKVLGAYRRSRISG